MGENKNMEKLAALQKEFFATGQTRELTFRMYQLQLLAKTIRENQEVLEAALKKDLGKSSFESYATEIGFVLADIRSAIRHLPKWMGAQRVKTPVYLFPGSSRIQKEP